MTIHLALAPVVMFAGLLIYLLANTNAKAVRIGEIMFAFGLLASLLIWGTAHGLKF